ncbi:helix-turn-helix domain-containing protein [Paenibacillus sp. LMG 31460]|uniref:Helix-turn-helix domain-containing protein n=1 Tax=Paenibacillus germinis TaxID=2654979 RepID=A0ABX1YXQ2_9BACL|nr:helix-turn-helix domain-containing protein [Paenibacillus germinis]NOU85713.1 helix-turn-helix domain-containing protein [Paenibacillus germinis]
MKFSISGKVMFIYSLVFITIIFLTFWLSYAGTVGRLEQDLKNTHIALLKQIDDKIEIVFRQTERDLLNMSQELEYVYFMYDSYDDAAQKYSNFFGLSNKLKTVVHTNELFTSIFLYSEVSGDILTDKTYMKRDVSEDNWLATYIKMKGHSKWLTTHKVWDGEKEQDVVTLIRSYPSISSPEYRKGLVAINISEDVLYRMIKDVYEEDHGGHTFIIDDQANIVTHDDSTQLYKNLSDISYIQQILSHNGSGHFTVKMEGIEQSIFYTASNYTGWRIVSVIPKSKVYQPLESTRSLMIAFAVGMVLLALTVLFYVNRRTFKPLDRLVGKMSGALKPVHPEHESMRSVVGLGYLETVFDQMFVDREQLEKQVRDSKPVLKWRIILDMLSGYRTEYASVRHHLEFTGIHLFSERFVVCTAEIGKEGGVSPKDETLYTYALCNVAEELMNMEHSGAAVDLGAGFAAIVFSFAEGDMEQNHLRALAVLELVLDVMKRQFGLQVTIGVGRCYQDMKDIPISYEESQKALQYKMVIGRHSVISIEDLGTDNQDYYRMIKMTDRIAEALKQTENEKLEGYITELFQEAVNGSLSPDLIKQLSYDLIMKSLQVVASVGINTEETLEEMGNLHQRIHQCDNWQDAQRIVKTILERLAGKIEGKRSQRGNNKTIDKLLPYIREHYRDSGFSLELLSEKFQLNPTYISKLFKEYTEKNFIDYLIEIRINASKELLVVKNRKINDIAERVGYTNTRSYLRAFKKYTGMTPTEYREWVLESEEKAASE